ncbi:hypothetical protein COCON_G00055180 [Conger conger]|uniref:Nck-associated protein 5 C-terminal domain-containing protein n=1 Tax=Conger conger TaxID=82655 RepID=A0A9Q1DWQ4_CONCO|nr:hypothetical protein COCON_G00055180 [Conger conger]
MHGLLPPPSLLSNVPAGACPPSPPAGRPAEREGRWPCGRFSSLSVTVPGGYLRASSRSSSELSLSSACSDFSSGSYTWNEGRASSKPSSLNWEKRSSLGSSAPSSICAPTEEQLPARKKECHILQGLRRLQRRKPKESSRSGASKSGYKDCMNSNEGIYSLGTKCVSQGAPKTSPTNRSGSLWSVDKGFPYDSDDADDEYPRPCSTDRWDPSHGKFGGLCGREEKSNAGVPVAATKRPAIAGYDSKERPEKLTSFLSGFLFGGRTRTAVNRSLPPCEASRTEPALSHPRHSDSEPEASEGSGGRLAAQPESDPRRLSRRVAEQLAPRVLRKDHYRAQSADGRPRPLSLVDQLKVSKGAQSEECIAVVFNSGDGRPVQYGSPRTVVLGPNGILRRRPQSEFIGEYTQLAHQGRPTCRQGSDVRNYSVLESPEKPVELHSPGMGRTHNGEGPQRQKPTRSPHSRAHKGHSVPPMVNGASSPKANSTKIPGRSKESPLKVSAEIGGGGGSLAPPSQERSPSSPPVKLSKFGRAPGSGYSAQSPRAAHPNSKLPCRTDWGKGPTSSIPGSPLLMRRHLEPMDCGSALQPSQAISDCTVLGLSPHNSAERVTKTRIPIGLKALVKSPVLLRERSSVSEQRDKDHVNIASTVSATSSTFNLREAPQGAHGSDAASGKSRGGMRPEVRCSSMDVELLPAVVAEDGSLCDEFDAEGRLFKRSISVTTKPHLKPALGMNGAKARSQSFSTHYMQKPSVGASEGSRVRTHIITNTGDRGSSLTRQSSLGDGFQRRSAGGSRESLPQTAVNIRQGFNGVMSGSNSNHGLPSKSAPRAGAQKEVRSLPLIDRLGPKTSRQPAKVASHPHFDSESFAFYSPEPQVEGVGKRLVATNKFDPTRSISKQAGGGGEEPEKLLSPSACTIEEKVMMGIQENVQRGQEQNKSQASEAKHKTGSSIANWFGFRKSKLPALGGKKNDTPKGKEEKKENKIGSVLGGRQTKPDKTKDKKKTEMQCTDSQNQTITDARDKLGSIMDQCHFQTGQHTNHIQHSMSYAGKDQFMKEIVISPQGIPVEKRETKEDIEIHGDAKTQSATQKISLRAEREADLEPEANCQDNMIGSGCQTRTLDSGIGTFPLPDSVARATGRHLPKSTSTPPGRALGAPAGRADDLPPTSPPKSQVPSKCSPRAPPVPSHSPSDCGVSHRGVSDTQTRLAKPTASGVMRGKRLSQSEFGTGPEDHGKEKEKRRSANHSPPTDRRQPFCSFSGGSSSDSKMDAEHDPSAPCLGHDSSLNGTRKTRQAYPEEAELKKGGVENHLSIMDCYQRDVLLQYRREELREAEHYSSSDRERKPQGCRYEGVNSIRRRVSCHCRVLYEVINRTEDSASSRESDLRLARPAAFIHGRPVLRNWGNYGFDVEQWETDTGGGKGRVRRALMRMCRGRWCGKQTASPFDTVSPRTAGQQGEKAGSQPATESPTFGYANPMREP